MIFNAIALSGTPIGEILTFGSQFSASTGVVEFIGAFNILIGATGAMTLVNADTSRYARTKKDVLMINIFGNLMQSVVMLLAGGIVAYVGIEFVADYYVANMNMTVEQAQAVAFNDMGAFFIILGGVVGFILMFLANGKAQVLNTYSGSLALTNLFSAIGLKGNRALFVVIANVLALLMIYVDILGLVESWLDALGVLTTCMATIIIVDNYFVRKKLQLGASDNRTEAVNIAGILTLVLSASTALYLSTAGIFPIPFLASTSISLIMYPVLRMYVFKPSFQLDGQKLQLANDEKIIG